MIWWVAYQRGSFNLKESYPCIERAQERCLRLLTDVQYLRVIAGDDIDGVASVAIALSFRRPKGSEQHAPAMDLPAGADMVGA